MAWRAFNMVFDAQTRKDIWHELRSAYPELLAKLSTVPGEASPWYRFSHLTPAQFETYQRLHNARLVAVYGEDHGLYTWRVGAPDEQQGAVVRTSKWMDTGRGVTHGAADLIQISI